MEGKLLIMGRKSAPMPMVEVPARDAAWAHQAWLELSNHAHRHGQRSGDCRLCRLYEAHGSAIPLQTMMMAPIADLATYAGWLRTRLYFMRR